MNDLLDIEIILNKQKYSWIYNTGVIIIAITLITLYIIFTYKYQSYYISKAKTVGDELEMLVNINDIKYLKENNCLEIDNQKYLYKIDTISEELIIDELYNTYQYVYIKVANLTKTIDNYIYEVKIPKENKAIAKYLKEYL